MTELKSWIIILSVGAIVGYVGMKLVLPNKDQLIRDQKISQCIKDNQDGYKAYAAIKGYNNNIANNANEITCREKFTK